LHCKLRQLQCIDYRQYSSTAQRVFCKNKAEIYSPNCSLLIQNCSTFITPAEYTDVSYVHNFIHNVIIYSNNAESWLVE